MKKTCKLNIALCEPEIPPNTGNIIRLCANAGAQLHLIHPLAFSLSDKRLRRAGLDYHEFANVTEYPSFSEFMNTMKSNRILACTTKANQIYTDIAFQENDVLLFGPETRGLSNEQLNQFDENQKLKIPMVEKSRSLNLSNATAIILYEAWRQLRFA